jgi:hypothetical protein
VCEICHGKLHRWKERVSMKASLMAQLARLIDWVAVAKSSSPSPELSNRS